VISILDIIEAKKQGRRLDPGQIAFLVDGFTSEEVPAYQMAAFLMAVWFRGLDADETVALTEAMLRSGEQLAVDDLGGPSADKHSTGGVGDKVSLLLAPLAAACGLRVPMLSGRGLGHTGGTLDKLEAIPNYNIHMENEAFLRVVREVGCAIVGQSGGIAPADGRIYALRDVTATVDCVPLITASIMSKKLAAGPETVVIDLKTGTGAFMTDLARARELAAALVAVGRRWGRRMAVVFSDMSQPLGVAVGHANETLEAFAALRPGGRGTAPPDLVALTEILTATMVRTAGLADTEADALSRVRAAWDDGTAWARLQAWVTAQGGRLAWDAENLGLAVAPRVAEVVAPRAGWLRVRDCREIGLALADLGGARRRVEDRVDPRAGLFWLARNGKRVEAGEPMVAVHVDDPARATDAVTRLAGACEILDQPWPAPPLVLGHLA
jgi:pyrimidine-nucleoside phosphorylase